ncbi:FUSC family protein [Psychroserpens sp. SPM9]|uniref:FUSC family protein n=1 Tax=Psychroserpens sp. SPM9 TaxID=2975598 RepID=UPI0021A6BC3E|nr:FUSC family protein [Psychroserpens sp. SPM9]MDG5493190.1 FUSC family protein [Psychroserpens sp. SPM9]
MKKLFLILGFITAILALILAVTPLSKLAYIPSIAALVFGVLTLYFSKDKQASKKSIQLVFLMTIIALVLTTYKVIFTTSEVGDTKQMEQKEEQLEEESLEELEDLDIDEIDAQ